MIPATDCQAREAPVKPPLTPLLPGSGTAPVPASVVRHPPAEFSGQGYPEQPGDEGRTAGGGGIFTAPHPPFAG
jgi:hypothetical protein